MQSSNNSDNKERQKLILSLPLLLSSLLSIIEEYDRNLNICQKILWFVEQHKAIVNHFKRCIFASNSEVSISIRNVDECETKLHFDRETSSFSIRTLQDIYDGSVIFRTCGYVPGARDRSVKEFIWLAEKVTNEDPKKRVWIFNQFQQIIEPWLAKI